MNLVIMPRLHNTRIYHEMGEVAWKSYKKYLAGEWTGLSLWEYTWNDLWKTVFYTCRELSRDNNLFLIGADTLARQPIEVFGKYQQMMMFYHTTPKDKPPYPSYLNSEPMFIPQGLSGEMWLVGERRAKGLATTGVYDEIQLLWNDMFWAQVPHPPLDPSMNWSPEVPNPLPEKEAKIMHFHASKDANAVLNRMAAMCA